MAIEKVELKDALNALVTNTNIDKVTGVLGGVPSNIAKADLASVMAGLMNTNKQFPFMGMSKAPSGDLNDVQTSGMYYLASTSEYTNHPGFGWCALIVFKTLYVTQVAFQSTGTQIMSRVFDGNNWSSWYHLDNFGYNSLADLSSAVAGQMKPIYSFNETYSLSLNNLKDNGIYNCVNLTEEKLVENLKYPEESKYWMVVVFRAGTAVIQFASKLDGYGYYVRTTNNLNAWFGWRAIHGNS